MSQEPHWTYGFIKEETFLTSWAILALLRTAPHYCTSQFLFKTIRSQSKAPYTLSVKLSNFTVWRHTCRENWVNWTVLIGNSADLRIILSSQLSHPELRNSLKESHSFFSLPADTTMASSQGTSVSSNSFTISASHDIFLFKYHFLLHILRFLLLFSDNIMADVARKQQTTALFLSTIVTRTRRHKDLTEKLRDLTRNLCCAREYSFQFFVQFF